MGKRIDGKQIALDIKNEVRTKVSELAAEGVTITLAVVLVGDDPASHVYVRNKEKACAYTGIRSRTIELKSSVTEEELLSLVDSLNADPSVDGILVQLPLPPHIRESVITDRIAPEKDVDGFHPVNVGRLSIGSDCFLPCTPAGIAELLKRSGVEIEGKHCVIVGRSNIVGKPAAMIMLRNNATVTVCHSRTKDLKASTRQAEILIVAIGRPKFITADYISPGCAVIDVGMDRDEDGKLCGDVDYEDCFEKAGPITPVPGGVGPMTIAMLMKNCLLAALRKRENS